jgi:hypothetical protein
MVALGLDLPRHLSMYVARDAARHVLYMGGPRSQTPPIDV